MINTVFVHLAGEPIGKGRPRFGNGRTYTPPATVAYEYALKTEAAITMKKVRLKPFEGPVEVSVVAKFGIPKSWSKSRRAEAFHHIGRPDCDNVLKVVLDALNGVVWLDDAQVCDAIIAKRYDAAGLAGLAITVTG